MAAKKKAAKAGAGAAAAGRAARSNVYVQRLMDDEDLRENLADAFQASKKAYTRIANGKGPAQAILDDKKTQRELKEAAESFRDAANTLRGAKRKRKRGRLGKLLLVAIVGAVVAVAVSEDVRKKVLDALFGAEEEFEYTSTTSPSTAGEPAASSTAGTT